VKLIAAGTVMSRKTYLHGAIGTCWPRNYTIRPLASRNVGASANGTQFNSNVLTSVARSPDVTADCSCQASRLQLLSRCSLASVNVSSKRVEPSLTYSNSVRRT
jgi:hypothetical protein